MSTSRVASLGEYLREQRKAAELSLRQLAEQAGVSNPYLSQVERGLRRPSAEVLNKIATALQISSEHLYIRAGLLDEESSPMPQVMAAVQADPSLTARQRQALLDIYAAFVAQNVGEPIVVDVHTGAINGAEPSAVPVGHASEKE